MKEREPLETVLDLTRYAAARVGENDSAKLCAADAASCWEQGHYKLAAARALRSLRHSLGVLHEDYRRAAAVFAPYINGLMRA